MSYILQWLESVWELFLDMSPYLMLGLTVSGILSVTLSSRFVSRHIGGKGFLPVLKASFLGIPLPLCSCGIIPTAGFMKKNGASAGALTSFLISTPQTGVDSIAATYGLLGPFLATVRPIAALLTGVLGGLITGIFGQAFPEKDKPAPQIKQLPDATEVDLLFQGPKYQGNQEAPAQPQYDKAQSEPTLSLWERIREGARFGYRESVDDIAVAFLVGLGVAALITLLVPDGFFAGTWFGEGIGGMLLMVAVGLPLYVCSTSSIPIALALIAKGISPGAAYVFLIAGPATNAATILVFSKVLGKRNLALYIATIIAGSVGTGFIIDGFLSYTGWSVLPEIGASGVEEPAFWFKAVFAAFLGFLLILSLWKKFAPKAKPLGLVKKTGPGGSRWELGVQGMDCQHCAAKVKSAVSEIQGIGKIEVDVSRGILMYEGNPNASEVVAKVQAAGYTTGQPN
jgi:uncharacterized membrane protein YraQ (UPF0718 family)/copper chaperone CopZ